MKDFLRKIAGLVKLDRRDWTVLLLSLLLALSIWFLHNLALKYTDFVTVSVVAKSSIDGRAEVSSNSSEVVARARCIGFNIIGMRLRRNKPEVVTFNPDDFHYLSGDTYFLTSKELIGYSRELFNEGSVVEYFVTDTVLFKFTPVSCKKVPVVLNGSFDTAPQYMIAGGIRFEPDSVTVYGDPTSLETVDGVLTSKAVKVGLDREQNGVLKLNKLKGLRLSDESVRYYANVVRYVDISLNATVTIDNKPSDKVLVVVPPVVSARISCPFPYAEDPTSTAVLYVDYKDYLKSLSGKCPVKLRNVSGEVLDFETEPAYVELIAQ